MKATTYLLCITACLASLCACQRVDPVPTAAQQKDIDDQKILSYFAAHNITNYQQTEAGNYIVVDSQRTENPRIAKGNFVYINYKLRLLTSDDIIDSNNTTTPYSFNLVPGQSGTIAGYNDVFPYLRKGEVAKLFIISGQGYGGTVLTKIPAYSVLRFDVKVVNVQ